MPEEVTARVWKHSRARGNTLLVLLALARCAGDDGTVRPDVPALARMTRLSGKTVRHGILKSQGMGELEVTEEDSGRVCRITVDAPRMAAS